jgi:membrane-bound lytic murein transglycosylase D
MKLLRWSALTLAALWLSGCALLGIPEGDNNSGDGVATGPPAVTTDGDAPPSHTTPPPQYGDMPPVAMTELRSTAVAPLDAPADLWERVRLGFAMPDLDNELVREQEQWYASRPDYIQRMVERSRLYLFHVVEELELRNMPTELALLPYIESAFNPQAVSSAKAAGLWQFMPGTGRDFQLTQNILRDDRRNVIDSTRAALDYLQKLHAQFGDWHLALAAYNWGPGNVKRAIERNRAANLGTGYADLDMPAETRHYVPKLQAVKNLIADPQAHRTALPLIDNHPFFDTVEITHDIDIDVAARLAEVRLEDFKALNPSQRKPVIFAAGTPQVLLPWNNAAIFKQHLAKARPDTLASWTAWVAPSALTPAEVAKQFRIDEKKFLAVNDIPRASVRIKAGSTVLVPRAGGAATAVSGNVVNNARLSYAPEVVLRRITVRARKGETLAAIAKRYDLPTATVAGWNKQAAKPGALKPGQPVALFLPVRAANKSAAARPAKKARAVAAKGNDKGKSKNKGKDKKPPARKQPQRR